MHDGKLSWQIKSAYGLGSIGEAVKTRGFDVFVFFYFQQVLGLSGSLAGLAVFLSLFADAVTDPVVGSLSDNLQSRFGRRHPYMMVAALPLGVLWFALFFPPPGLDQFGLFLWLTLFAILVRTAMTFYHVPHLALGAEMTTDYEEKTSVVGYRIMFGMFGSIMVTVIGVRLFFPETPAFENGLLNPEGYPKVALFGGLVMFVTIFLSVIGTRGVIPDLPGPPPNPSAFSPHRVLGEFREAWGDDSFRALFLGFSMVTITLGIVGTLGTHLYVFFWRLDSNQIALIQLPMVAGFIVGITMSRWLHRKVDKKPTIFWSNIVVFTVVIGALLLHILGLTPAPGSSGLFWFVAAYITLVGVISAIGYTSAGSMMADVAQEMARRTGRGQEGVIFSATSFSGKLGSGCGHLVAGVGLDLIAFPVQADPTTVPVQAIHNLGWLTIVGSCLSYLGCYFYTGYKITRHTGPETDQNPSLAPSEG